MTLQIGLLGCGRWGRNILRDLLSLDCEVHVYDPDPGIKDSLAEAGLMPARLMHVYGDLSDDLDGYVVATPTVEHYHSLRRLIPFGRPIFCEKPLCANVSEADTIANLAADQVFVMDKWRYHSGVLKLAEIAGSGMLGRVEQLRTIRVQPGHLHTDVDGCWILLPHDLSIIETILGQTPELVLARGDWNGDKLDGVLAVFGDRPAAIVEVSVRYPLVNRQIILSCEGGVACLESPLAGQVKIFHFDASGNLHKGDPEELAIEPSMPLYTELKEYCDFLRGGSMPQVNAIKAAETVHRIAEVREAARRH